MENHDIPDAEASDFRDKASFDVPFANVRGGFSGNGCDVCVLLLRLGGTDTLVLSAHVAFQGFLRFREIAGNIFDVDQRPRVVDAPSYGPEHGSIVEKHAAA